MKPTKPEFTGRCSICEREIPRSSIGTHNAQPVNNGRCCSDCNAMVVIPARMERMYRRVPPPTTN